MCRVRAVHLRVGTTRAGLIGRRAVQNVVVEAS